MSRNRDKILKKLAAVGAEDIRLDWTPIGPCVEMQGAEGGWYAEWYMPNGYHGRAGGYNITQLMEFIDMELRIAAIEQVAEWEDSY